MKALISVMLLLLGCAQVGAQRHHPSAAEKPVTLLAGMGRYHHPISTKNPDAQKFFDRGLTLLFGFNHEEEARSFRLAAELDPDGLLGDCSGCRS